ncbi:MAG TPA: hypothetical protein VF746_02320 [Longimicrobium sp.]|jgi:hypothetical protein
MTRAGSALWRAAALFLTTAGVLAAPASAQGVRDQLRIPLPPSFDVPARGSFAAPAIAIGVPTGFGADFGDVFVGVGYQSRTRFSEDADGGAVIGLGLGDARRYVGLEVAASQFGTFRSCCRGGLSFKLHRMLPGATGIAVGWENAVGWGHLRGEDDGPFTDAGSSVYGVVSKVFFLQDDPAIPFSSVAATVGVGNGRFRTEDNILEDRESANVFGSLAVRVVEPASVIASWTGQDLNAGVSLVPLRRFPLVITAGAADLTTEPRAIIGVGFGISYPY